MSFTDQSRPRFCPRFVLFTVTVLLAPQLVAQRAPSPALDRATLEKYDRNRNGVLDPDELSAHEADLRQRIPAETTAAAGADVAVLSPFEVVENTRGYYSANTMSGTRFNSKIEDLASSLTVVTKEQMADFAMLDINDIFAYTANTEGTHDFTDYEIDANGSLSDNVQLNPTGANRVRGMMAANISMGNTEMMGRTPIDPLGIDAIEISRGPNSTVFGLGSPAGTVNMVASSANLSRNRTQTMFRGDSFDGFRASLDFNRVLLKEKLAVRGSAAYQREGFFNKPSGVDSVRYIGMVKYQPFKKTTISGSYQLYRMWGNRPNVSPPRDNVSYWIQSGRPGWDPVRRTVTVNGRTTAPLLTDVAIPDYFNRTVVSGTNHGWAWVDENGNIQHWEPRQSTGLVSPNNTQTPTYIHTSAGSYNSGVAAGGQAALQTITQPLFSTAPSVSDKAIYDWTAGINLYAVNVRIDQIFFDTPRQSLAGQLNFQREDAERYERNQFGAANSVGASGQLLIDPNLTYLDGTRNPFFGRPFLNTGAPRAFLKPSLWDSYRAQLAYKFDLRSERTWLRWLGLHQITGYDEYKYRISRQYTFRDAIVDSH
jgi:outer membrane receptor protein involved in Fe transport